MGIRDDGTRRKLLQIKNLDLQTATDVCRATELANKHLKAMTGASTETVEKLDAAKRPER